MKKNILAISIAWVVLALVIGAVIVAMPTKKSTPITKIKATEPRSTTPAGPDKGTKPAAKNTTSNSVATKLIVLGPQYKGVIPPKLQVSAGGIGKISAVVGVK